MASAGNRLARVPIRFFFLVRVRSPAGLTHSVPPADHSIISGDLALALSPSSFESVAMSLLSPLQRVREIRERSSRVGHSRSTLEAVKVEQFVTSML